MLGLLNSKPRPKGRGTHRPDIAFVVGVFGRFMSNAGVIHYQVVKKVFRYL